MVRQDLLFGWMKGFGAELGIPLPVRNSLYAVDLPPGKGARCISRLDLSDPLTNLNVGHRLERDGSGGSWATVFADIEKAGGFLCGVVLLCAFMWG